MKTSLWDRNFCTSLANSCFAEWHSNIWHILCNKTVSMETLSTASIQNAYKRYSKYYDVLFGIVFHPGRQKAIESLNCQPGDRILEVGVGTGLSLSMYPPDVKVVGIDLSEDMLEKARGKVREQNLTNVEKLVQMDAQNMDFSDNSFDKVVAMYVASVVPDVGEMAKEIRRVCKPGGTIIFLNHFESKNQWIRKAEALMQPLAKYIGFNPEFPLKDFLKKTRFKVDKEMPANFLDYWTILSGKNRKQRRA